MNFDKYADVSEQRIYRPADPRPVWARLEGVEEAHPRKMSRRDPLAAMKKKMLSELRAVSEKPVRKLS